MEEWQEGEIIENKKWTENLASLKIKANINLHKAGQFTRLGLKHGNDLVTRSYSYASAPQDDLLEIIYVNIPNGIFSPRLHQLKRGDKVSVMSQAIGYFTLDEIPEGKNLWMLATGTALGVFLSILKTALPWKRFEKIILIEAFASLFPQVCHQISFRDQSNNRYNHPGVVLQTPQILLDAAENEFQT